MSRLTRAAVVLLSMAACAICVAPAGAHPPPEHDRGDGQLAEVRRATARYHSLEAARRAGYELAGGCVEEPGEGGMGYHYMNHELAADRVLDPRKPEVLLYERTARATCA